MKMNRNIQEIGYCITGNLLKKDQFLLVINSTLTIKNLIGKCKNNFLCNRPILKEQKTINKFLHGQLMKKLKKFGKTNKKLKK